MTKASAVVGSMFRTRPRWMQRIDSFAIVLFVCMAVLVLIALIRVPSSPYDRNMLPHVAWKNSNRHISNSINLTTYVASPCSSSNNDYNDWKNYTSWEDNDIKQHREDWQRWIENEFHQHYSFETANNTLIARGSPGFSGRGIVINMAGESLMHYFRLALHILRENGCFLPIEVWAFDGELSESAIQNLTAMSLGSQSITVRLADDPKNFVSIARDSDRSGYHIKMSSLANSRFEEVLMLDVDVVPLRNPEFLFEIPEYQIGGDLFWPDYWKTRSENPVWKWIGIPCVDEWEQESGMMVVNKRRAWKAIMLNWYLNRNTEIRTWHEFLFGDKDLFRFIWKATNTPAYFIQHWLVPGGFIQVTEDKPPYFCGIAMMQHDPNGNLLFAHLNLLKHTRPDPFSLDRLPIRYVKRYIPRFNESVPSWYTPRENRPLDPAPIDSATGMPRFYGSTMGSKALFHWDPIMCLDINDNVDDTMPERETEIVDLADEFPGFPEMAYRLLPEKEDDKKSNGGDYLWAMSLGGFTLVLLGMILIFKMFMHYWHNPAKRGWFHYSSV